MIRVWRLCQSAHLASALTGEGARRYGGRWNAKGQPAVYTAATLSLAALEMLAHVDTDLLPDGFSAFALDIPDEDIRIDRLSSADLPPDWRYAYPPASCQAIGSKWLGQGGSAVLAVPSAIIPEENNYILNPRQPDFARIKSLPPITFTFDSRLWR